MCNAEHFEQLSHLRWIDQALTRGDHHVLQAIDLGFVQHELTALGRELGIATIHDGLQQHLQSSLDAHRQQELTLRHRTVAGHLSAWEFEK